MIFFASKCTPITNYSSLSRLVVLNFKSSTSAINFNHDDTLKIIRPLNINKAHGHDNISIRMIKLCDKAIVKPLSIIYSNCTDIDSQIYGNLILFQFIRKKTNNCYKITDQFLWKNTYSWKNS